MSLKTPLPLVPSKDYARQYEALGEAIPAAIKRCLHSDNPILGDALGQFESALAMYHHVDYAIGVGSGSDAITLGLDALGIGPGDEVITCAHTFPGVLSAIIRSGATPVLVDGDPIYGLLFPKAAALAITPRTRAIFAVHLYGHPVNADELRELCDSKGLLFIEDAAQAHGATWKTRPVCAFSHLACLSFHPSKNLGAFGDGGAILTQDSSIADALKQKRNLGKSGKYTFSVVASNSKLDTLQAAILQVKLKHLDGWIAQRRQTARRYLAAFDGLPHLRLPKVHFDAEHAWHLFVIRTPHRDKLRAHLQGLNIKTSLHYPIAAPDHPAFGAYISPGNWPVARAWAEECLSLPISQELDPHEIDRVIAGVKSFFTDPSFGGKQ